MEKPTSICCDKPQHHDSDICPECGEHTEFVTDAEYAELPFPECAENCSVVNELGAGECDSVCGKKFAN